MIPRESAIEKTSIEKLEADGYGQIKVGRAGWPDRLVICPGGLVVFLEMKKPRKGLEPGQRRRKVHLGRLGHIVLRIDEHEGIVGAVRGAEAALVARKGWVVP